MSRSVGETTTETEGTMTHYKEILQNDTFHTWGPGISWGYSCSVCEDLECTSSKYRTCLGTEPSLFWTGSKQRQESIDTLALVQWIRKIPTQGSKCFTPTTMGFIPTVLFQATFKFTKPNLLCPNRLNFMVTIFLLLDCLRHFQNRVKLRSQPPSTLSVRDPFSRLSSGPDLSLRATSSLVLLWPPL